jgi:ribosomal protein S18 acetylase RimI-like enzyme
MSSNGDSERPAWAIRPFCMDDYPAVLHLWQTAGEGVCIRPSDRPEEIAKKCTRDADLFLVAESQGLVIGVIMGAWDGRRGWLHHLAVDASYQRRGIARALIGQVEECLQAKGCLKINLLVGKANGQARALYRELGYDEMSDYLPMGKEL